MSPFGPELPGHCRPSSPLSPVILGVSEELKPETPHIQLEGRGGQTRSILSVNSEVSGAPNLTFSWDLRSPIYSEPSRFNGADDCVDLETPLLQKCCYKSRPLCGEDRWTMEGSLYGGFG